jgi:predicted membrane metal-binding protein
VIAVLIAVTAREAKKFWGRNNVGVGTVMLSAALVMSIVRPATFLEVGTQLTFAALAGIAVAMRLARHRGSLYRLLSVTICAGLAAGIVGAMYFPPPPLCSLLVTLLLGPVVAVGNPVLVSIAATATYAQIVGGDWLLNHLAQMLFNSVLWLDHQVEISSWVSVVSGAILVLWGVSTYRGLRVTGNDSLRVTT